MLILLNPPVLPGNKNKAGIYLWTHKESGKRYVGSASNLKTRLSQYFNINYLERNKTMYICNALKEHGYSTFSLSIIEYICITDLSLGEAKILILEREQFYLDLVFLDEDKPNSYNLLPIAGSSLGYKHTEQSLLKFSGENHHMFGKNKRENPLFGRTHSEETLAKMRVARGTTIYVYSTDKSTRRKYF
jgi:group I intron endonuclease